MGPDCGTAVIRGVPLGFANVVRRGTIGHVGHRIRSQEVTCRIHQLGGGIYAIGTGEPRHLRSNRREHDEFALQLLAADPSTKIVAIVSKRPVHRCSGALFGKQKALVSQWLCASSALRIAMLTGILDPFGVDALRCCGEGRRFGARKHPCEQRHSAANGDDHRPRFPGHDQRFLRGLFSGGTFCYEAQIIWRQHSIRAFSNPPLDADCQVAEGAASHGHCALDLEATNSRSAAPIHDRPSLRIERLLQEARDPSVAVILLDVVLGYGSHEDPAGVLAPAIRESKSAAARHGRHLPIVCFVCGTEEDPQILSVQEGKLIHEGVCSRRVARLRRNWRRRSYIRLHRRRGR